MSKMSKMPKKVTYLNVLDDSSNELDEKEDELVISEISEISIRSESFNLSLPLNKRIVYLEKYNFIKKDEIGEVISSIIGMYLFSKTIVLKDYIKAICELKTIDIKNRIECAKSLCDDSNDGYKYINDMFLNENVELKKLATPIRVDTVMFLMDSNDYKKESKTYFIDIINDHSIEELYRLKLIQSLEIKFKLDKASLPLRMLKRTKDPSAKQKEDFVYFAKDSCKNFISDAKNTFTYRVIACQYIFEKCEPDDELIFFVENFLISVAGDVMLVDDLRADACDILMQYAGDEMRVNAQNIIIALGGQDNHNIFKNKQNVHNRHIEHSVQEIIDKLVAYHPKNKKTYDFRDIKDNILNSIKDDEKEIKEKVEGSLIRITLDRAVYGNSNVTLMNILLKVWTYIQDSPFREELEKRLIEELTESNSKCSSGFAGRLVNTLSGFDESMSISMGYEDQIVSNLEGRLNAKIRDIKDDDYMEKVLNEMTIPVLHYNLRSNFLKFFRENISKIREEMYQEFKDYLEDCDYDMFFRKAIIFYEGCN